jgi:hypothetical protein
MRSHFGKWYDLLKDGSVLPLEYPVEIIGPELTLKGIS